MKVNRLQIPILHFERGDEDQTVVYGGFAVSFEIGVSSHW